MIDLLAIFATAILLGGMVGFSFLFAPLVFLKLPAETAGPFIRSVFPWYYLFVLGAASLAALAAAVVDPAVGFAMAGVAVLGLLAREVLMPAINRARDRHLGGEAAAGRRFERLHRSSVAINFAQMAAAAWALAALAG